MRERTGQGLGTNISGILDIFDLIWLMIFFLTCSWDGRELVLLKNCEFFQAPCAKMSMTILLPQRCGRAETGGLLELAGYRPSSRSIRDHVSED